MEFRCLRCRRGTVLSVTEEQISRIDSEEFAGSSVVDYLAQEAGWVVTSVRRQGKTFRYYLCPECVELDFAAYIKLVE